MIPLSVCLSLVLHKGLNRLQKLRSTAIWSIKMDEMGCARYDYEPYVWGMNEVGHKMFPVF